MNAIQSGSPMAGGGGGPTSTPAPAGPSPADLVPLNAPTARPDEHVTAGMNSISGVQPSQMDDSTKQRLYAALPTLLWLASQPQASEQTRQLVRQIRGDL